MDTRREGQRPDGGLARSQGDGRQFIAISYDIPDDRRRARVCRLLKDYGERVQYSVFECRLRPQELERLQQRLRPLLVAEADDVRFYRLCETCRRKAVIWGQKTRRNWGKAVVV